jgi:integral membrane protein (TIGR01906 family)
VTRPPRWVVALFAGALGIFGVLQAVYVFAGTDTYRDLARGRGVVVFVLPDAWLNADESSLVALHERTLLYVLDRAPEPATCCGGRALFDESERAHLADVRQVFRAVNIVWTVAGVLVVGLLLRARLRGYLVRMVRDGALWSAVGVLAVGIVAAVAFEPAFLAFHYVFFPQGNFLFDPATSNLLRLYPESYWYGVTLRVGAAFIAVAAVLAGAAHLALRSPIVSRR